MATGLLMALFPSLGYKICIKNLLWPEVRDFWEKLGSCVTTEEEGGHVDLFVPLGASGQCQNSRNAGDRLSCGAILCVSGLQSQTNQFNAWINGSFLFTTIITARDTITQCTTICLFTQCIL